ncbi:hypothetical protein PV326_003215, partial [Microctonus aethiopoides]
GSGNCSLSTTNNSQQSSTSPSGNGRLATTNSDCNNQDAAAVLHRVLCAESFAENERRVSEMILHLQYLREQLVQQQAQNKTMTTENLQINDKIRLPVESEVTIIKKIIQQKFLKSTF